MRDDEPTPTNVARLSRESVNRQRGELPTATPGSLAEQMGYAPVTLHPASSTSITRREQRRLVDVNARIDWLEWRRSGIGASDIATLMGWGFRSSAPYKVWAQKVGLIPAGDDADNELYEYGHRAETMLRLWFEDATGLYVGSLQAQRRNPAVDFAIATIDGEVFESHDVEHGEPIGLVEFKTTSSHQWRVDDPVPDHYLAQVQWQMFVTGHTHAWLAVLHDRAFRVYRVERDEADIAALFKVASDFWTLHVLTLEPPELDGERATSEAIAAAYPGAGEDQVAWLPAFSQELALLREAKAQRDKWTTTARLHENVLREAMGNATAADFGSGVEVTWSRFETRRVDTKALKARYPDIYDELAKPVPSSRFTVRGEVEED